MLIDGSWGCGKTYQIREFLNKYNKERKESNKRPPKIYYLSLFGFQTIDEVNTALFALTNKKAHVALEVAKVVSRAIPAIPYAGYAGESIGYALGLIEKKQNGPIVIFDDLERTSAQLSYSDLLGYFSQLFLGGAKIICVYDGKHIGDREEDFRQFKEKVFDRYCVINETLEEVIKREFAEYDIPDFDLRIQSFGPNLRNAFRIKAFYKTFKDRCDELGIPVFKSFGSSKALDYLIAAIRSVFESAFDKKKDKADYPKWALIKDRFGEAIANELSLLWPWSSFNDQQKQRDCDLFIGLLSAYLNNSYSLIADCFVPKDTGELALFVSCFCLSDENKKKYCRDFFEGVLSGKIPMDNAGQKKLSDILHNTDEVIPDELRSFVAKAMLKNSLDSGNNEPLLVDSLMFHLMPSGRFDRPSRQGEKAKWKAAFDLALHDIIYEKLTTQIKDADSDYLKWRSIISSIKLFSVSVDEKVKNLLVENDFYLPDLSGDITVEQWDYCHQIAGFSKEIGLSKEFKALMKRLRDTHEGNASLKERVEALCVYCLGEALE